MAFTQHQILQRILICITFHWTTTRLPTLKLVLRTIADYPTSTTVCMITDQPSLLAEALGESPDVRMCGNAHNLPHPHHLAWVHRDVVDAAFQEDTNYTLFVYMEDDLELTWSALQAWAHDESLLAPLGFHRGFVRVEVAQWDGELMALDTTEPTSVSDDSSVMSVAAPMPAELVHLSGNATAHFVHLKNAYMAMWLGSRNQVSKWLQTPEWSAKSSVQSLAIREDAAWNLYSVESNHFRRDRHSNSLFVPYDPRSRRLADAAMLPHLSNNYCNRDAADAKADHPFCRIPFSEVLRE